MVTSFLLKHQDADGFIRASYWQLGAETGRMSCSDPNHAAGAARSEQFRSAVVAPEGWKLSGRGLFSDGVASGRHGGSGREHDACL